MASKKIIVVGSYIEALVMDTPRLPVRGETLHGKNFRRTWGGKGSNQAVQASRLGVQTAFVSMIGTDDSGDRILKLMQAEHVDTEYVFRHLELPTATGFIICTADGHNIITIDIAALQGLGKNEIDRALAHADAGTIVLVQLEIPLGSALYACEKAKSRGATVILNPAPAADLASFDLSCVDFLTPNEIEARLCLGLPPDHVETHAEVAAKILKKAGCSHVIMTLGEKGSLWVNQREAVLVPAFRLSEVVDSTGAGDAFNAGLAAALAEGRPILEAIRYGSAAGALSCTVADTIPSFHQRAEVERFIASN